MHPGGREATQVRVEYAVSEEFWRSFGSPRVEHSLEQCFSNCGCDSLVGYEINLGVHGQYWGGGEKERIYDMTQSGMVPFRENLSSCVQLTRVSSVTM